MKTAVWWSLGQACRSSASGTAASRRSTQDTRPALVARAASAACSPPPALFSSSTSGSHSRSADTSALSQPHSLAFQLMRGSSQD